jgi:hypothetical protein
MTKLNLVAEKRYTDCANFRHFRRQLFHTSLSHILSSLRPAMSEPEVVICADGLYRRVMYSQGPYIADYPEQVLVSGIVQGWCPRYLSTTALLNLPTPTFLPRHRCTSHKDDLETPGIPRSKEHMADIRELLGQGDQWDLYGVAGIIDVSTQVLARVFTPVLNTIFSVAIHRRFSPYKHLQTRLP